MGFIRFSRRMKIAPGISLNFSKSGLSVSAGPRGAKVTVGPKGVRKTVGLPGSGLSWTDHTSWKKLSDPSEQPSKKHAASSSQRNQAVEAETPEPEVENEKLDLGFFENLFVGAEDRAFIAGLKAFAAGDAQAALDALDEARNVTDANYFAGFAALSAGKPHDAAQSLVRALTTPAELGETFRKYGLALHFTLPVTDLAVLDIRVPDVRSARCALVEAYQQLHAYSYALEVLNALLGDAPQDQLAAVSYAELALEACENRPGAEAHYTQIVRLAATPAIDSPIAAALRYYKGCALERLGMNDAAAENFSALIAAHEYYPAELLIHAVFRRGQALKAIGRNAAARKDFEWVFAADPDYPGLNAEL